MSRIGKAPIPVPKGVQINVSDKNVVTVKGPKGTLVQTMDPAIKVKETEGELLFERPTDLKHHKAMHGLYRALVANMVKGVTDGFEKRLALVGVGYRAQAQGEKLTLSLGFSHPIVHMMPKGVKVETPAQTEIVVKGIDKQLVGQIAAVVRAYRPPEPYKGKGVRYLGEKVVLKETKKK